MLSQIRNSVFSKILWSLIGLHLLNISVDNADPNPEYIPEDLSFNDQESIIEIVIEKVLGYEDAIKEYDDQDTEDHNKKTSIKIDLTTHSMVVNTINPLLLKAARQKFPEYTTNLTTGFYKLDIPPPKI
ncbi:hypothetical protein SAMN04488009_2847 [Maribacter sedimenticola]|uniref:Uncharacterized protein n=1 Tax=Maribacter sedimenticola TaxID=228956 RepID=A0ABY1SJE4_9FLAO|nr:hypothetical protein [Maribacter sedimenticola]SNR63121.1 hypothetical protein SAMN04488009_2847 [Maribacter sedimenticola]